MDTEPGSLQGVKIDKKQTQIELFRIKAWFPEVGFFGSRSDLPVSHNQTVMLNQGYQK